MGTGYLQVSLSAGDGMLPISGGDVIISSNGNIIYRLISNEKGYTDKVSLDAPDKEYSLDSKFEGEAFAKYEVRVEAKGFAPVVVHNVEILDTITTVLPVNMLPEAVRSELIEIYTPPIACAVGGDPQSEIPNESIYADINGNVRIPDTVRVHLGAPTAYARNVTVSFRYYIKNVCSHEIYATWPQASLEANIYCQISFVLNRIYTEWYRSRGLNFDITNNTGFDQAFVYGGTIFENIDVLVDQIFNRFIRREGHSEPFFAEYCDGRRSKCPGLWQWGTVDLANQGRNPLEILRYYYPDDVQIVETNNIGGIEESYPGYPLREGMSNSYIANIQRYMNRIRVNFPIIPQITNPNGYFGPETTSAVQALQGVSVSNIPYTPVTGVVDRNTWYKIVFLLSAVKKLGELTSEGKIIGVGRTPPTSIISQGDRGRDVGRLQYLINFISYFYPAIPSLIDDFKFGPATTNAVREFQSNYNLAVDGIVGINTWRKLFEVYWGIRDNGYITLTPTPPTSQEGEIPEYPGWLQQVGSSGIYVLQIQQALNKMANRYPQIGTLVEDGIFGPRTQASVMAFQRQFGLAQDGIVGPITWERLMRESAYTRETSAQPAMSNGKAGAPNEMLKYMLLGTMLNRIPKR